jgi:hypothetical protein
MVSLRYLLVGFCFAAPIGAALGAVKSPRHAVAGLGGYALALAIGMAVGLSCAWAMAIAGRKIAAHIQLRPASSHERHFRTLYVASVFWIILAGALGGWLASVSLRLVF